MKQDFERRTDKIGELFVSIFHHLALFLIGGAIVWSGVSEFIGMVGMGAAPALGDILLLFIYLELLAMVGIYFKTHRLPVRYLVYIAITALTRVLTVDIKTMDNLTIIAFTGAILILTVAVLVLKYASSRYPTKSESTIT